LHGAAWEDFDNDGDPELFISCGNNNPRGPACANKLVEYGDTILNIAAAVGVEHTVGRARGGAWADIDDDGDLDLFVSNYFTESLLFLNMGDRTFSDVSEAKRINSVRAGTKGTRSASWADYDGDGDMDLLTVGIESGMALYRNEDGQRFEQVAEQLGLVTDQDLGTENNPWAGLTDGAWGDFDNDGDLDLYIAAQGRNLLFEAREGRAFVDVATQSNVGDAAASVAAMWGDFDNDGNLDLYVVNAADPDSEVLRRRYGWNALYRNQGDGTFVDIAPAAGAIGSPFVRELTASIADYDADGSLDLYVANEQPTERGYRVLKRDILLQGHCPQRNSLSVILRGSGGNREAIGANVTVLANGMRLFREQGGGSHAFGQHSNVLHFGLGGTHVVDVVVRWPGGRTDTLVNVRVNQTLELTEGA
jgi:hypothetical protein